MNFILPKKREAYENLNNIERIFNCQHQSDNLNGSLDIGQKQPIMSPQIYKIRKSNSYSLLSSAGVTLSSPKDAHIIEIYGANEQKEKITTYEQQFGQFAKCNPKPTKQLSMMLPQRNPFIQSMIDIGPSQNRSVKINEIRNQEFLKHLDENILELSKTLQNQTKVSQPNKIRFILMILDKLLNTLNTHSNVDLDHLNSIKQKISDLEGIFFQKFKPRQRSKSLLDLINKIKDCVEEYSGKHTKTDIILRVGSMENVEMEVNDEFKKNTFSTQKIQDPEEFMLRTRIMKSKKYANLIVDTKNVAEFRYVQKPSQTQSQKSQKQQQSLYQVLKENAELIIVFLCAFIVVIVIVIVILFIKF